MVNEPAEDRAGKASTWITRAQEQQKRSLEKRPWTAFLLAASRRFKEIEGKHLAIVIALNLFVAVIPLLIIGYAFISAFNPHRDVGNLIAGDLHLTGSTAQIVKDTFSNAHMEELSAEIGAS